MKSLDQKQIKEIASFFTTASVAWFTAGVVGPLFSFPNSKEVFILSLVFGLCMTIIFLIFSVIISKENK